MRPPHCYDNTTSPRDELLVPRRPVYRRLLHVRDAEAPGRCFGRCGVAGVAALGVIALGEEVGWWHMEIRWEPYFLCYC